MKPIGTESKRKVGLLNETPPATCPQCGKELERVARYGPATPPFIPGALFCSAHGWAPGRTQRDKPE